MFNISDLINKFKNNEPVEQGQQADSGLAHSPIRDAKNWHEERYENITVQRNLLFVLLLILLILSITSVAVATYVINAKRFDPFVIQINKSTGVTTVVNPETSTLINGNEALAEYFIKKYVVARETYNPVDFSTESKKIVRLFSSNSIYWSYRGYLKNDDVNPSVKYGQKNTTFLLVKSWSKLSDKKYIFRFSINETSGARNIFNKIAVVEFDYVAMELTEKERDINPIGFQVTGYRVDDDSS
ncbi:VirB8/TrbF family protein [Rickettsiaceae bacterium]|nr:VirB8/TrbF family protein [Rickettsiaceae bacterium]